MHTLGKVLLGFVCIGCLAAIFFSAKLLYFKNSWMKKAEEREQQLADITRKNKESQQLRDAKESELHRLVLGWDRYWNNISFSVAKVGNAPPTITITGVGSDKGLVEKQRLAIFSTPGAVGGDAKPAEGAVGDAPVADAKPAAAAAGTAKFLGIFVVTATQPERAGLAPEGRPTPEQIASWNSGTVRVRTLIPSELEQQFIDLEKQLLTIDELIAANQANIKRHDAQKLVAEQELDARQKEIEGNPELKDLTLPAEVKFGLLATLAVEEEQRNSALELVKSLQTRLKDTVERIASLRTELEQMVRSLPQPSERQARRELSPR